MPNNLESVDSLEAFRASEREALAPYLDDSGYMGAVARSHPLSVAFTDWAIGEMNRGGTIEDVGNAVAFLVSSMIHDTATSIADSEGLKHDLVASLILEEIKAQLEERAGSDAPCFATARREEKQS